MLWLKGVHLVAIAFWAGGLLMLPSLFVRRQRVPDQDALHRLQAVVRFVYVAVISPAAFLAVASGIGLAFLREAFLPWFSLKLLAVGVLVALHILAGMVVIRLFEEDGSYPPSRAMAATTTGLLAVTAILVLVLAKPDLPDLLPKVLSEPGGLRRLLAGLTPVPR
jgi:Predicted membrane protein